MSHHTRVRASLAAWESPTAAVTAAEMEEFDANQFASINGDAGGTWAPTPLPIEIGGMGLVMSGPFVANGSVAIYGGTTFYGNVVFQDNLTTGDTFTAAGPAAFLLGATFHDPVDINDTLEVDDIECLDDIDCAGLLTANDVLVLDDFDCEGLLTANDLHILDDLEVEDDVTVHSTLTVEGAAEFENTLTVHSDINCFDDFEVTGDTLLHGLLTVEGRTEINDDVTLGNDASNDITMRGTMTLETVLEFANSGRVPFRPLTLPNDSVAFTVQQANLLFIPSASIERSYNLNGTHRDGDFFIIVKATTTAPINLLFPGDAMQLPTGSTAAFAFRQSGTWVVCRWDISPG